MVAIEFKKLFGRFDYKVKLNNDGLTILTGPNGYGKSTILRSIEAIGNGITGIVYFFSLDFKKITFWFERRKKVVIEKRTDELIINNYSIKKEVFRDAVDSIFERRPYMVRIDEDTWRDRRNGARLSTEQYVMNYIKDRKRDYSLVFPDEIIQIINDMRGLIGDIYFIEEQRLIRTNKNKAYDQETVNIIDELPNKFKVLISSVQQNYSAISSELDSTYPNRLFENEEGITKDEYQTKMLEMKSKFDKMIKYDLSALQTTANFVFKEEHAKALKIYFDDFDEKYSVYEELINKMELYTDIINARLSFKEIKISPKNGIYILDENNKQLELRQLSSGEKQEIVLFYELIFGSHDNELLMIDEPEISLHIAWQKRFMNDLIKIIEYKHINAIVATHSPQIINHHWDKQIDLGELYGKQLNKR